MIDFRDPGWLAWERRLVRGLRAGRRRAIAELYRAMAGPLYTRVILPRVGDAATAEDILADSFRILLEQIDRFEDRGGGIWPWLATIAARRAVDAHRREARTDRGLTAYAVLLAGPGATARELEDDLAAHADVPRVRVRVQDTLARINPRYRRAIELRVFEERPRVECAGLLDVRVATFDVVLLRALRAFRKVWNAQQEVGDDG